MPLSEEQATIVAQVCSDNRNYVIQGVPGAGKSKVVIDIGMRRAATTQGCSLLLTFSSALKEEGRARSENAGLRGKMHVHSYHSSIHGLFAGASVCPTDADLRLFLANTANPEAPSAVVSPKYTNIDTLFLDEAQDMTPLYLDLVQFLLKQHTNISKIVVLGDWFQSLFRYNGSFTGVLERPDFYLGGTWAPLLQLSTSFRLPPGICHWINTCLDPRHLRDHYPHTWQEIGPTVTRFWGEGIRPFLGHPLADCTTQELVKEVVYTDSDILNGNCASINAALEELGYERGQELVVLSSLGKIGIGVTPAIVNERSEIAWSVKEGMTSGSFDASGVKAGLVCSPMYYKGMEAPIVVTYCSMALEPRSDAEGLLDRMACLDAFSALYVACTRSTQGLVLLRHIATPRFFTERKATATNGLSVPTSTNAPRPTLRNTSVAAYLKFADPRTCDDLMDSGTSLEMKVAGLFPPVDVTAQTHVKGVFGGTTEDVFPLITKAIELALSVYWKTGTPFATKADWVDATWMVLADAERTSGYKHLSRQIPPSFDWLDADFMTRTLGRTVALMETLPDHRRYVFQRTKLRIAHTIASFPPTLRHDGNESVIIIDWSTQSQGHESAGVDTRRAVCNLVAYKCTTCYVIYPVLGSIRSLKVVRPSAKNTTGTSSTAGNGRVGYSVS